MRILKKTAFVSAAQRYPNHQASLLMAYHLLNNSTARSAAELKKTFNSLDRFRPRKEWYVLDIAGNHLRLIVWIGFAEQVIYVKHILTHADYDKANAWYLSHPTGVKS